MKPHVSGWKKENFWNHLVGDVIFINENSGCPGPMLGILPATHKKARIRAKYHGIWKNVGANKYQIYDFKIFKWNYCTKTFDSLRHFFREYEFCSMILSTTFRTTSRAFWRNQSLMLPRHRGHPPGIAPQTVSMLTLASSDSHRLAGGWPVLPGNPILQLGGWNDSTPDWRV